jgi:zinc protease
MSAPLSSGFGTDAPNFQFITAVGDIEELLYKPNGLRVLLYRKPVAPVVTFNLTYLVGSRNEVGGSTGGTHFLEHLMFKGSKNFNRANFSSIWNTLQTTGARVNATTYLDRTNYYATLPANYLELSIAIEADRMRDALFTAEDLASEMSVVRNELERGENSPKEVLEKLLWAQAFVAHPYHTSTIGHVWDIENVSVEKLRAFYNEYYHPNNAVAVVVGDFERAHVLSLLHKHFGRVPRAPADKTFSQRVTAEPEQEGNRRFEVRRVNTQSLLGMGFHAPPALEQPADCHALQVLDAILSNGPTSRLYAALMRTGLASSFSVSSHAFRDGGLFEIYAKLSAGVGHAAVEAAIFRELERVAAEGVTEAELAREKQQMLASYYFSKDGDSSIASQLNESIAAGSWQYYPRYLEYVAAVTPADCKRVAAKYLRTKRGATVGWFFGEESPAPRIGADIVGTAAAAAESLSHQQTRLLESRHLLPADLQQICNARVMDGEGGMQQTMTTRAGEAEAEEESFILSSEDSEEGSNDMFVGMPLPESLAPTTTTTTTTKKIGPAIKEEWLSVEGGRKIHVLMHPTQVENIVYIYASLLGGSQHSLRDPAYKNPYIALFTAELLTKGSTKRSEEVLSDEMALRGASISSFASAQHVQLCCQTLTNQPENLPALLSTLAEQLRTPLFSADKFELIKKITLNNLRAAASDIYTISSIMALQAMYPPSHPRYKHSLDQQIRWANEVTLDQIRAFHRAYGVDQLVFSVVGTFDAAVLLTSIRKEFGDWRASSLKPLEFTMERAARFSPPAASAAAAAAAAKEVSTLSSVEMTRQTEKGATLTYRAPSSDLLRARTKTVFIDNQPNAVLLVTQALGIDFNHADFHALQIGTFALGGNFSARLMQTVRDRQGLTYGINSSLTGFTEPSINGFFQTKATFAPKNLVRGEAATLDEIAVWLSTADLSDAEILSKTATIIGSYKVSLATAASIASIILSNVQDGRPKEWIDEYVDRIGAVTPSEVRAALKRHLSLEDFFIVKVGTLPS